MPRYLISFDDGAMTFAEEELPEISRASHEVVQQAKEAGVWIFGAAVPSQAAGIVGTDGSVTDGPYPETKAVLGGFCILEVAARDEALEWAGRFAEACRCAQEVRELGYDPES